MKFNLFRKSKDKQEIKTLKQSAKEGGIDAAYTRRAKEIESLRQYDRGEKEITSPDIRSLVRNLLTTR